MKITRRQLSELLKEAIDDISDEPQMDPKKKLLKLVLTGDPENISQAAELADAMGVDFKDLIGDVADQAVESISFYNILSSLDDAVFDAKQAAVKTFGFNVGSEDLVDENDHMNMEMELVYGVKMYAQAAISKFIVDMIMGLSEGKINAYN